MSGDTICQECGEINIPWFAPNEIFNKINGSPNGVLCPKCFMSKADSLGENIIFTVIYTNEQL